MKYQYVTVIMESNGEDPAVIISKLLTILEMTNTLDLGQQATGYVIAKSDVVEANSLLLGLAQLGEAREQNVVPLRPDNE